MPADRLHLPRQPRLSSRLPPAPGQGIIMPGGSYENTRQELALAQPRHGRHRADRGGDGTAGHAVRAAAAHQQRRRRPGWPGVRGPAGEFRGHGRLAGRWLRHAADRCVAVRRAAALRRPRRGHPAAGHPASHFADLGERGARVFVSRGVQRGAAGHPGRVVEVVNPPGAGLGAASGLLPAGGRRLAGVRGARPRRSRDGGRAARPGRRAASAAAGAGLSHPLVQHRLGETRAADRAPGTAVPGSAAGAAPVFAPAALRHRDHRGGAADRGDPGR